MHFSVTTPVFNGMPLLSRCIGSVKQQAAPSAGVSVDHHIQDGGSSDGSRELVSRLVGERPGYRLSGASEPDRGMYDAINKGWARSSGDWLCWLNADEQYLPGALMRVAEFAERHPEADILFGDILMVDQRGEPMAARREIGANVRHLANGVLYSYSAATFFRRRLLDEGLLMLDPSYRLAGDFDLVLKLLTNGNVMKHFPGYLSLFTNHGENLTTKHAERMRTETEQIRIRYGGHNHPVLRRFFLFDRWVVRLLSGCYKRAAVVYEYALDEVPHMAQKKGERIGFRFRI